MKCPKCESPNIEQIDEDLYQCPYCGMTFNSIQANEQDKVIEDSKHVKSSSQTAWVVFASILVLAVIFAVVFLIVSPSFSNTGNVTQKSVASQKSESSNKVSSKNIRTVEVIGKDLRLRLSPSTTGETLQFRDGHNIHPHKGDILKYISETDDWYYVKYNGHSVYISKMYAVVSNSNERIQTPSLIVITGNSTVMRLNDYSDAEILRDSYGYCIYLKKWNTYKYLYETDDYYAINYHGKKVFVSKNDAHSL